MNQSINDEAVCRTAPATPGLLKRQIDVFQCRHILPFLRKIMFLVSATKIFIDNYDVFKLLRCLRASLLPPVRMKKQSLNSVATPGLSSTESLWTRR